MDAHAPHQGAHMAPSHIEAFTAQPIAQHTAASEGIPQVQRV